MSCRPCPAEVRCLLHRPLRTRRTDECVPSPPDRQAACRHFVGAPPHRRRRIRHRTTCSFHHLRECIRPLRSRAGGPTGHEIAPEAGSRRPDPAARPIVPRNMRSVDPYVSQSGRGGSASAGHHSCAKSRLVPRVAARSDFWVGHLRFAFAAPPGKRKGRVVRQTALPNRGAIECAWPASRTYANVYDIPRSRESGDPSHASRAKAQCRAH